MNGDSPVLAETLDNTFMSNGFGIQTIRVRKQNVYSRMCTALDEKLYVRNLRKVIMT